ncbi:MAG TPA: AMP-binding protein, partial [Ignavibacteriaceae bacterium]|nr:AMP-binding protein [Ignavibacteriaceae bacterium]
MIVKNRLIDILPYQIENYPRLDALCDKKNGAWQKYSTLQVKDIVDKFSLGLLNMGFQQGDKFSIISPNRTEWTFVDLGILQMGGVDVPIYPNMNENDYTYIFNDAQVKLVFVGDKELYNKVKKVIPKTKSVMEIYTFDEVQDAKHWSEILAHSDDAMNDKLSAIEQSLKEDDLA